MSELVEKLEALDFGDAGEKEKEKVMVNLLEEAYHVLACLYRNVVTSSPIITEKKKNPGI